MQPVSSSSQPSIPLPAQSSRPETQAGPSQHVSPSAPRTVQQVQADIEALGTILENDYKRNDPTKNNLRPPTKAELPTSQLLDVATTRNKKIVNVIFKDERSGTERCWKLDGPPSDIERIQTNAARYASLQLELSDAAVRTIPFTRPDYAKKRNESEGEFVSVYETHQLPSLWRIPQQKLSSLLKNRCETYKLGENQTCLLRFAGLKGLNQNGEICKFTALAGVEWFHTSSRRLPNVSLRKGAGHYHPFLNEFASQGAQKSSIRQLAKTIGKSVQGEALERNQLDDVAQSDPLQYKSTFHECKDFDSYRDLIFNSIDEGKPPIVFFPILVTPELKGLPHMESPDCEHGAIVIGYDRGENTVSIVQWQKVFHKFPLENLFEASGKLRETRDEENYRQQNADQLGADPARFKWKIGSKDELLTDPECEGDVRTSITPRPDSGFKHRIWIVEPGDGERWNASQT
ncbi:MAG: hypothetical protein JWM42_3469 [Burkholderia sp.]|nr:hypothetical protein [Burkholderia sp.]